MAIRDEKLTFVVDGQELAGTFIAPQLKNVPGILFVHGWGASQQECFLPACAVAELGCGCLIFDLRGHGLTRDQRAKISREDNLRDVLTAYDVLANRPGVDASALGMVGTSYGAYLSAIATTLRSSLCLALQAPAIYRDPGWLLPKLKLHEDPAPAEYRRRVVGWNDNRALQACAAFRGDVLIIESEQDVIVPHPIAESYTIACIRARSVTSRIIVHADHGLSEERWRREYISYLTDWLTRTMV
jgi:pimeloyl-ACP methyl ester carboxylesterase